jgi:hypothetical protein
MAKEVGSFSKGYDGRLLWYQYLRMPDNQANEFRNSCITGDDQAWFIYTQESLKTFKLNAMGIHLHEPEYENDIRAQTSQPIN